MPLDAMELVLTDFLRRLLLAIDGERAVIDGDTDVFPNHVRELGLQDDFVLAVLVNVDRGHPAAGRQQPFVATAICVAEDVIDAILQVRKLTKRVTPTND